MDDTDAVDERWLTLGTSAGLLPPHPPQATNTSADSVSTAHLPNRLDSGAGALGVAGLVGLQLQAGALPVAALGVEGAVFNAPEVRVNIDMTLGTIC